VALPVRAPHWKRPGGGSPMRARVTFPREAGRIIEFHRLQCLASNPRFMFRAARSQTDDALTTSDSALRRV
jgi:hypothetical protein